MKATINEARTTAFQTLDNIVAHCPDSEEFHDGETGRNVVHIGRINAYYQGHVPFLIDTLLAPELELTTDEQKKILAPFAAHLDFGVFFFDVIEPVFTVGTHGNHDIRPVLADALFDRFDKFIECQNFHAVGNIMDMLGEVGTLHEFADRFEKRLADSANARCRATTIHHDGFHEHIDAALTYYHSVKLLDQDALVNAAECVSADIVQELKKPDPDWHDIHDMEISFNILRHGIAHKTPQGPEARRLRRAHICDVNFALRKHRPHL